MNMIANGTESPLTPPFIAMSIHSPNLFHASMIFSMTFAPSAGMDPCHRTTAVPTMKNTASLMNMEMLNLDAMNAVVAARMMVGTMFGRSPHFASWTDHPTIDSIHSSKAIAIHSLIVAILVIRSEYSLFKSQYRLGLCVV